MIEAAARQMVMKAMSTISPLLQHQSDSDWQTFADFFTFDLPPGFKYLKGPQCVAGRWLYEQEISANARQMMKAREVESDPPHPLATYNNDTIISTHLRSNTSGSRTGKRQPASFLRRSE
jgi:hypothetical protein